MKPSSEMKKIGVAILGATGFGGGELLRLIANHPEISIVSATSTSQAGRAISQIHPHLNKIYDGSFSDQVDWQKLKEFKISCVISALPHGESASKIGALLGDKLTVEPIIIDLSGDLRIQDLSTHGAHYPHTPAYPELRSKFTYGIPELFKESIARSNFISNPGCLATVTVLALAPLASNYGFSSSPICNLATGSSGAGKEPKASTHHPIRHSNYFSYKPLSHQHTPEIEQALSQVCGSPVRINFVPHSLPTSRGIFATIYCELPKEESKETLTKFFEEHYRQAPFVRVLKDSSVELENVIGTNFCDISIHCEGKLVVINAAIDNLIKGMAGQAIQNLNIRAGISETAGLWFGGLRPI